MVNIFKAAAAGLLAFISTAQAASVGNQFSSGYVGSLKLDNSNPLTVRYSTSQPNDKNWIGIWPVVDGGGPVNQVQGSKPSVKWNYAPGLDGLMTIPTDGVASGDYNVYFLGHDGYTWQAAPLQVPINKGFSGSIDVTPGYPIKIHYRTSQPNEHNWIALYFAAGGGPDSGAQVDQNSVRWVYAPNSEGDVTFGSYGLGDGVYKAYFLGNDGYGSIASPQIFSQGNAVFKGVLALDPDWAQFTFRYTTQRPGDKNWIGIWPKGLGPVDPSGNGGSGSLVWEYAKDTHGVLKVDGSKLGSGEYSAYFLENDNYKWLASPIEIAK